MRLLSFREDNILQDLNSETGGVIVSPLSPTMPGLVYGSPWLDSLQLRDEEVGSYLLDSTDEQDEHCKSMRDLRRLVCL